MAAVPTHATRGDRFWESTGTTRAYPHLFQESRKIQGVVDANDLRKDANLVQALRLLVRHDEEIKVRVLAGLATRERSGTEDGEGISETCLAVLELRSDLSQSFFRVSVAGQQSRVIMEYCETGACLSVLWHRILLGRTYA